MYELKRRVLSNVVWADFQRPTTESNLTPNYGSFFSGAASLDLKAWEDWETLNRDGTESKHVVSGWSAVQFTVNWGIRSTVEIRIAWRPRRYRGARRYSWAIVIFSRPP